MTSGNGPTWVVRGLLLVAAIVVVVLIVS